jgi:hypothetical protein
MLPLYGYGYLLELEVMDPRLNTDKNSVEHIVSLSLATISMFKDKPHFGIYK